MTRYLVFGSDAATLCGVEAFARNLRYHLGDNATESVLDLDLSRITGALADNDAIILNFPIVAWKKRLVEPSLVALMAKLRRRRVIVILHEWASLDWKRRVVLWPVLMLADAILFSAPEIEREWGASRFPRRRATPTTIIPIPPNVLPGGADLDTPAVRTVRSLHRNGRTIIGQFGSIYPKKNCAELLSISRLLNDQGLDVAVAFVGSFVKGMDNVEDDFRRQVEALELGDRVVVTGYLATDEEVFAACRQVDIFCYRFAEGLTSRRGSVLAAALAGRIVVTNAPADPASLEHHDLFKTLIANGRIVLAPQNADAGGMAEAVRGAIGKVPPPLNVNAEIGLLWQAIMARLDAVQR